MATHKGRRKIDHRTRVGRERSARTETRILEAALGVFADMGPDAPKIDDFVQAAGISRGTFYNYFESVEELLAATSEWTTRELIETHRDGARGASRDPRFASASGSGSSSPRRRRTRSGAASSHACGRSGGLELPARDLEEGLRLGIFRAPSAAAARDLLFGGVREALLRIGNERTPPAYGAQMTELCLQALGTDARRIAAVMKHELPPLACRTRREQRAEDGLTR